METTDAFTEAFGHESTNRKTVATRLPLWN
jgi:hypothetical protein